MLILQQQGDQLSANPWWRRRSFCTQPSWIAASSMGCWGPWASSCICRMHSRCEWAACQGNQRISYRAYSAPFATSLCASSNYAS
eukprot:1149687-Pelagomonas_calceolata.AAC.4